jgi:hypothetical protein
VEGAANPHHTRTSLVPKSAGLRGKKHQKIGKSHNNLSNDTTTGLSQQSLAHVNEKFGSRTFPSNQEMQHSVDSEDDFWEEDNDNDQPRASLVPKSAGLRGKKASKGRQITQ